MTRSIWIGGLAAAVLVATPAHAGTKYYFACTGDAKVQSDQAETWTTDAPTDSFQSGAGCGSADVGAFSGRQSGHEVDFFGGGTHTGAIQAVNVELHSLLLTRLRVAPAPGMEVELTVDGKDLIGPDVVFRPTPVLSSTGLTEAYRLSIAYPSETDEDGNELPAPPLIESTGEHTISIRISSAFVDYQNVWVWGATEVPSHVEFDPVSLSSPTVFPAG